MAKSPEEKAAEKAEKAKGKALEALAAFSVENPDVALAPLNGNETAEEVLEIVKKAKADKKAAEKAEKGSGSGFQVLDSNGKPFRTVEDKEEADTLSKQIGGTVAR